MLSYAEYKTSTADEAIAYSEALQASSDLAATFRNQFETFRRHRDTSGISDRLMHCLRAYNGEYSPTQLAEIRRMNGSEVFMRITAVKCRSASALFEDLYLGNERPWEIEPTPEPTLPEDVREAIKALVFEEVSAIQSRTFDPNGATSPMSPAAPDGAPPSPQSLTSPEVLARMAQLHEAAMAVAKKKAVVAAKRAESKLEDILVEGQFYQSLRDFLRHFSIFPVAVLKGPFFRMSRRVRYVDGQPIVIEEPVQFYAAPSPFDVWFAPGVASPEEGDVIERIRLSKQDLEALKDAPGYDREQIEAALYAHPGGHYEITSTVEQTRADEEGREAPVMNDTGLYDVLEFHGYVDYATVEAEPLMQEWPVEEGRSVYCTVRMLGCYIISAQMSPDPLQRSTYATASFEEVPGSVYGRGLPEVLMDVQAIGNAAGRALVNNMGLSSGPQVGINTSALAITENTAEMYPWKRWYFSADPAAPSALPITFFQPQSNAQELLTVIDRVMLLADEVSAIPRYASGGERVGGAGKTASGLSMLMSNVSKMIKHMAAGIDDRVIAKKLQYHYDLTLLTDTTGTFRGDETIRTRGVQAAEKQEIERMRTLEFLQITGNPIDMQILGAPGRAMVLADVAQQIGFNGEQLAETMREQIKAQAQAAAMAPPQPGAPPGAGAEQQPGPRAEGGRGNGRVAEEMDNRQRTRTPQAIEGPR